MNSPNAPPECPRIRVKEVARILGCSVSTVWAWSKAGLIPRPTRVGNRFTFWLRDEILNYAINKYDNTTQTGQH